MLSISISNARKLPAGTYLTSAKINVIENRPEDAVALLDSLFMFYGPHDQGLGLMAQIMVDYIESKTTAEEKAPYVEKMVAYFDSLRMCCDNKDIKKGYRKKCKDLIINADSTAVKYWREFYNRGIEQMTSVEELFNEKSSFSDSASLEYYNTSIAAKADSSIANMNLAIAIDPADQRPYVVIGTVFEKQGKYEESIEWLQKGLAQTEDSSSLLLSIAYAYINIDEYCKAAPFFARYLRIDPTDLSNATNLTICYIRCDMMDSAKTVYLNMLEVDSVNPNALVGLGDYYRNRAGLKMKESAEMTDKNPDEAINMREQSNYLFDTSATYYERLIATNPDSILGYEEYGLISYIRERYDVAAKAYTKLTEMEPENIEHWISLGDCYLVLKQFKESATAYEKVVELDKDKKSIWERLSELYIETGEKNKKAQADKEIARLSN
jgi:tetratricopeptide (TPR) repeat protein